jgi:hypothetical protein
MFLSKLGYSELIQRLFEKIAFFLVDPLLEVGALGRPSLPTDIVAQGADSTRHAREQGGDTCGVDGIWQVNAGPAIPPG